MYPVLSGGRVAMYFISLLNQSQGCLSVCSLFSFIDFEFYVQNFLPLWKLLPACISRFRIAETTHISTKFTNITELKVVSQGPVLWMHFSFCFQLYMLLKCLFASPSPLVFFFTIFPIDMFPLPFSRYLLCIVDVSPYFKPYHKWHLSHVVFWLYFLIKMFWVFLCMWLNVMASGLCEINW